MLQRKLIKCPTTSTHFQKVQEKHLRRLIKKRPDKIGSMLKSVSRGRFITQTKRTQKVLNFDSVGHLGDKSTFTSLCYTAKAAADLWKGIDCIRQIMRLR